MSDTRSGHTTVISRTGRDRSNVAPPSRETASINRFPWDQTVYTLPSAPSGPRPASTATLSFDEPKNGAVEDGDRLEVVLTLEGGRIVEAASTDLTPDTGHVHIRLDGKLISMTYGLVQEVDLTTLAAGDHALEAEFVAADHGPFSPRVTTTVHFTTEGP